MKNYMRFLLVLILLALFQTANAANLISGSLDSLKTESQIVVSLDCSKCVYRVNSKELSFEYFLAQSPRHNDWERRSLEYFIENFNEKIFNEGMIAFNSIDKSDLRYEMIITPKFINKNGDIGAEIYVKDKFNDKIIATIFFKADGDNDDKITLRDPLRDAGEDVGNMFRNLLKGKTIKIKTKRHKIDNDDIYN